MRILLILLLGLGLLGVLIIFVELIVVGLLVLLVLLVLLMFRAALKLLREVLRFIGELLPPLFEVSLVALLSFRFLLGRLDLSFFLLNDLFDGDLLVDWVLFTGLRRDKALCKWSESRLDERFVLALLLVILRRLGFFVKPLSGLRNAFSGIIGT